MFLFDLCFYTIGIAPYTGTFNNRQLSQILDYLRISSRIDYSIKRMEMDDSLSAQREQVVLRRIK